MSEWREETAEVAPRDWGPLKQGAIIGVGCSLAVIAWMIFARPSEEAPSTRGFNMSADGGGSSNASSRTFATRPKTSLDMVSSQIGDGPPGVSAGLYAGSMAAETPEGTGATAGPSPTVERAAAPPVPPPAAPSAADDTKEMASAGIPTDANGLSNLGAKEGLLSALAAKMLNHPKVLAAVFNNKMVVDAFMSRGRVKENCQSGAALKTYLSDPNSGGMTRVLPVIQQAMSSQATSTALVSALSGTEMVKRLSACPSAQALSNDSTAVMSIAMSNPKAFGVMMDPRAMAALAANPQAAGALAGLQSKAAGGK
jgi:hypothetical protein